MKAVIRWEYDVRIVQEFSSIQRCDDLFDQIINR